jgi:LmbE family N-acetylglucosaminyl deacetylase
MRHFVILLLFAIASPVSADDSTAGGAASVAVVLDLSFSMGIVDPGTAASRYRLGADALRDLIGGVWARQVTWALITADDHDTAAVSADFGSREEEILSVLDDALPWGTTSLDEMLKSGAELLTERTDDSAKYLLLISDCINTHGDMYGFPDIEYLAELDIVPLVLGFRVSEYPQLRQNASAWVGDPGFLLHSQTSELRRIIDGEERVLADNEPTETLREETTVQQPRAVESEPAVPTVVEPEAHEPEANEAAPPEPPVSIPPVKVPIHIPIWWIPLIPIIGLGFYLRPVIARWLRERKTRRSAPAEVATEIRLLIAAHGAEPEERVFESFPVKVAATGKADLILEHARISSGARTFTIVDEDGDAMFRSRGAFVINGVGRRSALLAPGDRIAFGRYRIDYGGVAHHAIPVARVPVPRSLLLAPLVLAFAALAVVLRNPVEIWMPDRRKLAAPPPVEKPVEVPVAVPAEEPIDVPAEEPVKALAEVKLAPVEPTPLPPRITRPAKRVLIGFPTVMWEPQVVPDYSKLDALFVHAHPDDESLDFGVLISRLADSGRKVGVVLLTDGDSGLDQYPERSVGDLYPAHDLHGDALADVRYREARSALSMLGAHHYVRLGLRNHPYGGELDVLTPRSIMSAWGGEDILVERLSELIAGFEPDIVISPEGPTEAFEHFEHETVGALVEEVLKRLGTDAPPGRLVSIDPLQKALFDDAVGIRADGIHRQSGLEFRAVQAAALSKHLTQRDASVIGVENLSNFSSEYYRILRWDFDVPIEAYLAPEGPA